MGAGFLRGLSPLPRTVIGTGSIDALDFQTSPSGLLEGCGLLGQILEDPGLLRLPKSLALTALFSSLPLGASPHPHFPPRISSHCLHLSEAYIGLHCPLKLKTLSSQKEVVCRVIWGAWVREELRAFITFPRPHSCWGDMDHSF